MERGKVQGRVRRWDAGRREESICEGEGVRVTAWLDQGEGGVWDKVVGTWGWARCLPHWMIQLVLT